MNWCYLDLDPNNPVVQLCVKGMESEGRGLFDDAARLFLSAWNQATTDFERCIAAHYVARHQKDTAETLRWNEVSLAHADAVGDDRVRGFYPSLYLNLGKSHEDLGNAAKAQHFYELAAGVVDALPVGRYGGIVRDAVQKGLLRVGSIDDHQKQ